MARTKPASADYTNTRAKNFVNTNQGGGDTTFDYKVTEAESTTTTEYQMNWNKWNGYYEKIPEIKTVVDRKAFWTIGKGYTASPATKEILDKIRGSGKDTFNLIIDNMIRTYTIGGDSYAEIVKAADGRLLNLKPLNPGSIKIIANDRGVITKYEQWAEGTGKKVATFQPEEIFHLPWGRTADAIHGTGMIEAIENVILMRNEAMHDLKTIFHRYVKPLWIFSVDTDDTAEIETFKAKIASTLELSENLVVPKDTVDSIERVSIPQYSTLDPLPWLRLLQKQFILAVGVPEVVLGHGEDTTEATSKILYLAFQQMIEWNQKFLEEQLKAQVGIELEFIFPASIEPALLEQQGKARNTNNFEMGHDKVK